MAEQPQQDTAKHLHTRKKKGGGGGGGGTEKCLYKNVIYFLLL